MTQNYRQGGSVLGRSSIASVEASVLTVGVVGTSTLLRPDVCPAAWIMAPGPGNCSGARSSAGSSGSNSSSRTGPANQMVFMLPHLPDQLQIWSLLARRARILSLQERRRAWAHHAGLEFEAQRTPAWLHYHLTPGTGVTSTAASGVSRGAVQSFYTMSTRMCSMSVTMTGVLE
jgi:hypothetical protein